MAREQDQRRGTARQRGYGSAWDKRRAAFLLAHPWCEDCGEPSTDADHTPSRRELVASGVVDPDDDRFLHARCHRCHSRKTAARDGGFGRAVARHGTPGPIELPKGVRTGPTP
jgi:5-methylcytosine-specific restriction protein A